MGKVYIRKKSNKMLSDKLHEGLYTGSKPGFYIGMLNAALSHYKGNSQGILLDKSTDDRIVTSVELRDFSEFSSAMHRMGFEEEMDYFESKPRMTGSEASKISTPAEYVFINKTNIPFSYHTDLDELEKNLKELKFTEKEKEVLEKTIDELMSVFYRIRYNRLKQR